LSQNVLTSPVADEYQYQADRSICSGMDDTVPQMASEANPAQLKNNDATHPGQVNTREEYRQPGEPNRLLTQGL